MCLDQRDCGHCPQETSRVLWLPFVTVGIAVVVAAVRWAVGFARAALDALTAFLAVAVKVVGVGMATAAAVCLLYALAVWAVDRRRARNATAEAAAAAALQERHYVVDVELEGSPQAAAIEATTPQRNVPLEGLRHQRAVARVRP